MGWTNGLPNGISKTQASSFRDFHVLFVEQVQKIIEHNADKLEVLEGLAKEFRQ
jgi:hypothetical protein